MKWLVLVLSGLLVLTPAHAASFDCTKAATSVEKMICADSGLSRLDEALATTYHAALKNSHERPVLARQQRLWLEQKRNACQDADCLTNVMKARIASLSAGQTQSEPPSRIFRDVLSGLNAKTQIPVLLPAAFPAPIKEREIHYVEVKANPTSYSVTMYYEKGYGDAAYFGEISGKKNGKLWFNGTKVSLAKGLMGYFRKRMCGGSCAPTPIAWFQEGVLYAIQLKVPTRGNQEEKRVMVEIANSMIRGGRR